MNVKKDISDIYKLKKSHKFRIPDLWTEFFEDEKIVYVLKDIWQSLRNAKYVPSRDKVFSFLEDVHPEAVKVVIVGQDPYDKEEEATGMAFSIPSNRNITVSLSNIYKEIKRCYDENPENGSLRFWRDQGVLLLNSALTVYPGGNRNLSIKKHYGIWRSFIMSLLCYINNIKGGTVFMFWGAEAKSFTTENSLQERSDNLYLYAAHPANRSDKFVGNNNFVEANSFLRTPIIWHSEKEHKMLREDMDERGLAFTPDETLCKCLFRFSKDSNYTPPGRAEGEKICYLHSDQDYTTLSAIEEWRVMLCNSYKSDIKIDGIIFPSVERYFRAKKYAFMNKIPISEVYKDVEANKEWKLIEKKIMMEALEVKFNGIEFQEVLLQTKSAKLEYINKQLTTYMIEQLRAKLRLKLKVY